MGKQSLTRQMNPSLEDPVTESCKKSNRNLRTLDGGKRSITSTIHDILEISKYPDLIKFMVYVCSSKDSIESIKTSIKQRIDYVLQTLRSHRIGERRFPLISIGEKVMKCIAMYLYSTVMHNSVRMLVGEKLDSSEVVSPISCHCTSCH